MLISSSTPPTQRTLLDAQESEAQDDDERGIGPIVLDVPLSLGSHRDRTPPEYKLGREGRQRRRQQEHERRRLSRQQRQLQGVPLEITFSDCLFEVSSLSSRFSFSRVKNTHDTNTVSRETADQLSFGVTKG